jgi:hypothetical protein
MHLSSPPYVPHVLPISFFLTLSPEWYLVRNTEHKALVMQSSSRPLHLIPLWPKYSPQHLILENPQPNFLPQFERPSFTRIRLLYPRERNSVPLVQKLVCTSGPVWMGTENVAPRG